MEHLTDTEFEEKFADCTLPPEYFTHLGHVRLAWIHLRKYGLLHATEHLNTQIRKYDAAHGDGTKFHKTLTVAAVYIVHHFLQQSQGSTFEEFIDTWPQLGTSFRQLIAKHYSEALLQREDARTMFLEPDLHPF